MKNSKEKSPATDQSKQDLRTHQYAIFMHILA